MKKYLFVLLFLPVFGSAQGSSDSTSGYFQLGVRNSVKDG